MDSDRKQCPFCLKWVTIRRDGKLPAHRRTNRMVLRGSSCSASKLPFDQARQLKAEGKEPPPVDADGTKQVEPEEIF